MSMTRAEAAAIIVDLAEVAEIRIRAMMGGWLVSAHGTLVGQPNDGELFFKSTRFADTFGPELERRAPYPGAKPAIVVPADGSGDGEWLRVARGHLGRTFDVQREADSRLIALLRGGGVMAS